MIKKMGILMLGVLSTAVAWGQQKSDTVIVSLGKTSKVIFTMQDRSDLDILKHYNFQDLFHDILTKIEQSDSSTAQTPAEESPVTVTEKPAEENWNTSSTNEDNNSREELHRVDTDDDDDEEWENKVTHRRGRIGRTWQSFNFDL